VANLILIAYKEDEHWKSWVLLIKKRIVVGAREKMPNLEPLILWH
jgi:hypothetical protein